jgi:hypothetical protein
MNPVRGKCRFCEREIAFQRFTAYLRPHKMPIEKHRELWPTLPYLDGWCPGGQDIKR